MELEDINSGLLDGKDIYDFIEVKKSTNSVSENSISETQLDAHTEKGNTNKIEEHDVTLDKGVLHSLNKGNGVMPRASFQGTLCKERDDGFVKDDLSNNEKADGQVLWKERISRKGRKRRSECQDKRTKSVSTSKKAEIDEFSGRKGTDKCKQVPGEPYGVMMLKPPGSSLPVKSAFEIMQESPVSSVITMTPETMLKDIEEFISPDSGLALSFPWSNSLEKTPSSSGFESCTGFWQQFGVGFLAPSIVKPGIMKLGGRMHLDEYYTFITKTKIGDWQPKATSRDIKHNEYGRTPSTTKRGNAINVEEADLKNIIDEQSKVDLVRKLQRNYIIIKREIDPSSGLADELFQAEIIMEHDYEKIRSARDMVQRSADLLLKAVAYNITPLKLKRFIYALRKCNYDYIADLLQNNPNQNLNRYSDLPQFSNYKSLQGKLGRLRDLLLTDFDPKYVIDELLEMEVISFIDHEDIWTTQFNEQRIEHVLKCVMKNIEINLGPFCCILRKHSEWLAEKIDILSSEQDSSGDSDANAALELSCKKGNWTGHIEGSFKNIPDINIRIEFKTEKIQNVDDDVVRRQGDSTNPNLDATLSKVHFKYDRVDRGSIIVRLQPLSTRALKKLKDSKPEDVMAIVKSLLTKEDLQKLEAAKLTSVEIKIEASETTLPTPISMKEEGITREAIVQNFTYLSTCVPNIKEFIPAFFQDEQISDELKTSLKQIISMKGEDRNEAFLRFLLQEDSRRSRIIFKRQLRKMKEISILRKLDNRNEIDKVFKDKLGKDEIQMNYSYLLDELDGREFLKIFSEKGFLNEEICDKILKPWNRRERTQVFIDFVLTSKDEARALFFQELEYKHQAIYSVLITTKQAFKPSAESQSTLVAMKAAICERYDEVIGEAEPKAYRDAFVERKIFTDQEFKEMVKICPRRNRAAAFLKQLLHGNSIFALKTFLWVLKRTGNECLANGLENDFYMFDGEEVNLPEIDCTNKCTLMTAVLEARIIIGKETPNNCAENGYPLLEYPLECWDSESIPLGTSFPHENPTELVTCKNQKVVTWMQSIVAEKIKLSLHMKRNYLSSTETSPYKTIYQAEINDTPLHSEQNIFKTVTGSDMAKTDVRCTTYVGTSTDYQKKAALDHIKCKQPRSVAAIEAKLCSNNQYKRIPLCRIRRSLSYQSTHITYTCIDEESNDTRIYNQTLESPQDSYIDNNNDCHESSDSVVTLVPSLDIRRGDACSERHSNSSPKSSSRKSSTYSQADSPVPIAPIQNPLPRYRRRRRRGCSHRRRKHLYSSDSP